MKKIILPILILGGLGYFIFNQFFYIDPQYGCRITVIPSFAPSNNKTKEVLTTIKYGSPTHYKLVCEYVTFIDKNPTCGGFDGGCFHPNKPTTIHIGNDQGNLALAAALVVHETCHAIQGHEKRIFSEPECYKMGAEFLETVTKF